MNEDRPTLEHHQRRTCSPVTVVSRIIKFVWIFVGFLGERVSNDIGVIENVNFQFFGCEIRDLLTLNVHFALSYVLCWYV